jgi:hypothetical protein
VTGLSDFKPFAKAHCAREEITSEAASAFASLPRLWTHRAL